MASKNFSSSPPVKFGVQASTAPKVTLWKQQEKFDRGEVFVLKVQNFKTIAQVEQKLSQHLKMMPALNGMYTPQGKRIKEISEISSGMDIVCVQSGQRFNREKLPQKLAAKMKAAGVATPPSSNPSTPTKKEE